MRNIVEREIIQYYIQHKDIGIFHLNYLRKKNGLSPLEGITEGEYPRIINDDIQEFLKQLTNEELFMALDHQFCDRYR